MAEDLKKKKAAVTCLMLPCHPRKSTSSATSKHVFANLFPLPPLGGGELKTEIYTVEIETLSIPDHFQDFP